MANWTGLSARQCPFCGGLEIEVAEIDIKTWAACCRGCNAIGPHADNQSILGALDSWNGQKRKLAEPDFMSQCPNESNGVYTS